MSTAVTIQPDDTVNAVIQRYPAALPILAGLGFDTCCGGGIAIGAAAQARGLTFEEVVDKLQRAGSVA